MSRPAPSLYSRTGHFGRPEFVAPPDPLTQTYGKGRVCGHEGCGTVLSEYNPHDYCTMHEDEQWDSLLHECTEAGMWVCPRCGKPRRPAYLDWRADRRAKDGFSAICRKCEHES